MPERNSISSILAICLAVASAGCSASSSASKEWASMSLERRQAALDVIADECKLARSALMATDSNELRFQPPNDATFDSVDCALKRIKPFERTSKIGFVGHEVYANETETK